MADIRFKPVREIERAPAPSMYVDPSLYQIVTAEILYWMPDHHHVVQSYLWQKFDIKPRLPHLAKFLEFWEKNLDGKIHQVRLVSAELIKSHEWNLRQTVGIGSLIDVPSHTKTGKFKLDAAHQLVTRH